MSSNVQTPPQGEIQTLQLTGEKAALAQSLLDLVDQQGGASSGDSNIITSFLRWADDKHFLVSPITAAPSQMLPGVEIQFTKVKIKTGPGDGEIYKLSGQKRDTPPDEVMYSLHKPAVDRIGLGRGITWTESYRMDDESVPFKVRWQVKGYYLSPDMQKKEVVGTSEIDLSDGGPGILKIRAEQSSQQAGDARIRMMRYKIVQLAETNARMRAIFGQGIKMAFSLKELKTKFFICVQPMITGRCPGRPDLEQIFAQSVAANLSPNKNLLYGAGGETTQSPSPTTMVAESLASELTPAADPVRNLSPAEQAAIDVTPENPAWIIPFGKHKDKRIDHEDITNEVLGQLIDYVTGALEDENQAENQPFYADCKSEIEKEITRRQNASTGSIDQAAETLPAGMNL